MSPETENIEQADQVGAKLKVKECFFLYCPLLECVGALQAPIVLSSDSEDDTCASAHMVSGVPMWTV
jgi:hypothetical protein